MPGVLERERRASQVPTAEDIFRFLPGYDSNIDEETFTRVYQEGLDAIQTQDIEKMNSFGQAFMEEMGNVEQLNLALGDLDINPFTNDDEDDARSAAARRVVNLRRSLEMEDSGFWIDTGRSVGESVNEMFVTPLVVAGATGAAGAVGGGLVSGPPGALAGGITGFAAGYGPGMVAGFYRLLDRVYNQSVLEYQNNMIAENRRRHARGEEMISIRRRKQTPTASERVR